EYTAAFQGDLKALNILEPTVWCKATDHIREQVETIRLIEQNGFTYRTSDGIYFDTRKLPGYGALAGLANIEGIQAGSRVEMGEKRAATDFALWKFSPAGSARQMEWDSPWGRGFPGWHIECSAMSAKYLGTLFDIHCGGEDHIAIHHTNEIAQTEAAYGTKLANYWLHGFFLQLGEQKMAKSSGGFLRLQLLADKGYDPLAYRYFCLGGHYRTQLKFSWESLTAAQKALENLRDETGRIVREAASEAPPDRDTAGPWRTKFLLAVNDDLNMPRAMALVWELVKAELPPGTRKATLLLFDRVLGLGLADWTLEEEMVPTAVMDLVQQRQLARQQKRYKDADALRGQA
ncbi:cysteine--tRNA ligase, partial [bacterium]|nr:cysteine--tRNA ligase [bacterium]